MLIELELPLSYFSSKISKFYASIDSEHKFHNAGIKNWESPNWEPAVLIIDLEPADLEYPWLETHSSNNKCGSFKILYAQ